MQMNTIFTDPRCGNGMCEGPYEFPAYETCVPCCVGVLCDEVMNSAAQAVRTFSVLLAPVLFRLSRQNLV